MAVRAASRAKIIANPTNEVATPPPGPVGEGTAATVLPGIGCHDERSSIVTPADGHRIREGFRDRPQLRRRDHRGTHRWGGRTVGNALPPPGPDEPGADHARRHHADRAAGDQPPRCAETL